MQYGSVGAEQVCEGKCGSWEADGFRIEAYWVMRVAEVLSARAGFS